MELEQLELECVLELGNELDKLVQAVELELGLELVDSDLVVVEVAKHNRYCDSLVQRHSCLEQSLKRQLDNVVAQHYQTK